MEELSPDWLAEVRQQLYFSRSLLASLVEALDDQRGQSATASERLESHPTSSMGCLLVVDSQFPSMGRSTGAGMSGCLVQQVVRAATAG